MRWRATLLAVVAALAAACSGNSDAGPTATLGTAPPATATDPYAVPEVIDVAYVNRVLAGLDQAVGDVNRIVVATRTIPPEAVDRLKSLYDAEFLQLRLDLLQEDMQKGFVNYRPNPGNPKTTVAELITSTKECVFARVARDYSAVSSNPSSQPSMLWVALKPVDPNKVGAQYNPTAWYFAYDGFERGRVQPDDPCVK